MTKREAELSGFENSHLLQTVNDVKLKGLLGKIKYMENPFYGRAPVHKVFGCLSRLGLPFKQQMPSTGRFKNPVLTKRILELFAGEAFSLMEGAPNKIHRASTTFLRESYWKKHWQLGLKWTDSTN